MKLTHSFVLAVATFNLAIGAPVAVANLPLGTDDQSYFGSFGPFCDADDHGVLVVTEVIPG